MLNIKINNMPDYGKDYKYIVATLVDGELWFYGAYNEYEKADCAANETDGHLIIENSLTTDSKHGHWFITEYEYLNCSVCGHSVYTGCDCTSEAKQRLADGDVPNYCPHCGAKMNKEMI